MRKKWGYHLYQNTKDIANEFRWLGCLSLANKDAEYM